MRKAALALIALTTVLTALSGCVTAQPAAEEPAQTCPPNLQPATCELPPRAYDFHNLVFEGGGVKGAAYPGALLVLEQQGILKKIRRVAGTSAGSIAAALVALGYSPQEIETQMLDLDFKRFEDGSKLGGPERLIEDFGWFKGDYFLEWMQSRVQARTGNPDSTFADLHKDPTKYRDLYVVASDLSRRSSRVLSFETSPNLPIAQAVRASMSIPLFFEAFRIDDSLFGETGPGKDVFVDGGVFANYPIELFDETGINRQSLGLFLDNLESPQNPDYKIDSFPEYVRNLFEALLNVQVNAFKDSPDDIARTVIINNLGVRTTDFGLSEQTKCQLMQQGALATCNYLGQLPAAQPQK